MIISKNIRALRSAYNLTQRELAEIASVTENAVSKWENGYAAPRLGAVEKITSHFGLSTSALLESFEIQNGGGGDRIPHDHPKKPCLLLTWLTFHSGKAGYPD